MVMAGQGEQPAGKRLATDKRHRVDTAKEATGLSLRVGGKERVGEVCPKSGFPENLKMHFSKAIFRPQASEIWELGCSCTLQHSVNIFRNKIEVAPQPI